MVREITIKTTTITLHQFLKWADIAESGGEAKHVINNGGVTVNGELEKRRGRQLVSGDLVTVDGIGQFRVTGEL